MKSELCWDKNPEIEQTETLDYFYLKICASMECFKLNMKQETYNNIKTYSTSFNKMLGLTLGNKDVELHHDE